MNRVLPSVVLVIAALFVASAHGASVDVEVSAGNLDRAATPVFFQLPKAMRQAPGYVLAQVGSDAAVPVQVVPGRPPSVAWMVRDLPAGQTRRYRLQTADSPVASENCVTCTDDGTRPDALGRGPGSAELQSRHAPVARGNRSGLCQERTHPPHADTGGKAGDGRLSTGPRPPARQSSSPGSTRPSKAVLSISGNQAKKLGSIEHLKVINTVSGPVFAQFTVSPAVTTI